MVEGEQLEGAIRSYQIGGSITSIANEIGVAGDTVRKALTRAGVTLRPRPGWTHPEGCPNAPLNRASLEEAIFQPRHKDGRSLLLGMAGGVTRQPNLSRYLRWCVSRTQPDQQRHKRFFDIVPIRP